MSHETSPLSLDRTVLDRLDADVPVPRYERQGLRPGIVHLGVGGFHRAHLATYVHELCQAGHRDWSIVGAGVMPGDRAMAEALEAQDHLYTLITRGADHTEVEVIGSIVDYILAVPSPDRLVAQIAAPTTQIVSLTVTEGGYPVDDATGAYLPDAASAGPDSAFSILAQALAERHRQAHPPITVLSCDNIVGNGRATRTATVGAAARIDDELADWISDTITFPNSMVDRITPGTTDADRAWLSEHCGIEDRWPVVTEPFRQWVVEDAFGGDRLPVDELDVIVTSDVEPYELMKLRLLNAGHSCLAYLAAIDGHETVDAAMADPHLRRFVLGFLDNEAKPALPPVAGIDLDTYTVSIVERFSNPAIGDQIARLCLDGTAKFPKFLLPTIRAQLELGGPVELAALALAGWCHYLDGAQGIAHSADPLLATAIEHAQRARTHSRSFLEFGEVFGTDLAGSERFAAAFDSALALVRAVGVRSAIETTL